MEKFLTIVIPVYNEAENISEQVESLKSKVNTDFDLHIIYDFEEDTTIPVVRELQKKYDNILLIKNIYGRGVLNAIKTGFETSDSKYTLVTMGDLSDPPEVINDMLEKAEEIFADIVCASRYMKGGKQIGGPFIKGLMSRVAGLTLHYFAKIPTHDATNSFKLYKTSFLRTHKIESTGGFELALELVVKAFLEKKVIAEVPTVWKDRAAGKSNFKIMKWLPSYLKWYFMAF